MGREIERKFRVHTERLPALTQGQALRQGYICTDPERVVRVRIAGSDGFITLKGKTVGSTRLEFEYAVPLTDAQQILEHLCHGPKIDKIRYRIPHQGHTWEVDVFEGDNQGLIIAEVELGSEGEAVCLPDWISQEVTGEARYYNSNLLHSPYKTWAD